MRWGLLSTARINHAVLDPAAASGHSEVVAVGSRDEARARAYAGEHGIPRAHGSYEALLADPEVDAVYVSVPNGLHVEWSVRALEAGKHVLVEKPLTLAGAREAERAFDAAERAGRVLSEAFMWRHHPQTARMTELVRGGAVGEVRLVRARFSFDLDRPADPRWDPALEGGALADIGCYCVSAARLVCGEPEAVSAARVLTASGVDVRFAGALRFGDGALATFDCGFDLPADHRLEVVGSEGTLVVGDPWHAHSPGIELRGADGRVERVGVEQADAYGLQLEDLAGAIAGGRPPLLGRDDAVGQARALELLQQAAS